MILGACFTEHLKLKFLVSAIQPKMELTSTIILALRCLVKRAFVLCV